MTRFLFQRALGLVYLLAFINAWNQFRPLLGERGLLPVPEFVRQTSFEEAPSLFQFFPTDRAFSAAALVGIVLASLAVLGIADRFNLAFSMAVWGLLWLLYLSFVNVGQTFYGFGWESILLEAGFYALFLGQQTVAPPKAAIWMLRALLFRVMFGAGIIKWRGDSCWHDLTCLNYHYETQPMPNALSPFFHWAPAWTHRAGVLFNHLAELVIPFFYFLPSPFSALAGLITILFQSMIMASGNLAWLNFLTIVLAIPLFNDRWLAWLAIELPLVAPAPVFHAVAWGTSAVIAFLSLNPLRNMLSKQPLMNFNYNSLHLASTYGAFGGVTRTQYEVIIEGTDAVVIGPETKWHVYDLKGKPADPAQRPPQIAPYHLRLDWLMWFAAMGRYTEHPWFVHLMQKLLLGDPAILKLFRTNPFPMHPPHFVRAELYEYHFTTPTERRATGQWWTRRRLGDYFPVVSLQTPGFQRVLQALGWQ